MGVQERLIAKEGLEVIVKSENVKAKIGFVCDNSLIGYHYNEPLENGSDGGASSCDNLIGLDGEKIIHPIEIKELIKEAEYEINSFERNSQKISLNMIDMLKIMTA